MLTLKDIRKSYPSGDGMLEVLKGINISFRKNEFTSILGTSGSGKTTLLNIIGGLERTREIGILRAVGASKKDIVGVFRAETVIEGLFAGTMGVLIAWLVNQLINVIAKAVSQIDGIARLPLPAAVILILLSVVLNVIAGSIPSRIAAKKDPVEALRAE